jgi:hypothetical protein
MVGTLLRTAFVNMEGSRASRGSEAPPVSLELAFAAPSLVCFAVGTFFFGFGCKIINLCLELWGFGQNLWLFVGEKIRILFSERIGIKLKRKMSKKAAKAKGKSNPEDIKPEEETQMFARKAWALATKLGMPSIPGH